MKKYMYTFSIYVCVHTCLFLFICTYMYAYFYVWTNDAGIPAYTHVHTSIHAVTHIYANKYIHTDMYLYFHLHTSVLYSLSIREYMHVLVCIHTHTLFDGTFPEEYMRIARVHEPYTWEGVTTLFYLYINVYIFTTIHRYTHLCVFTIHVHICVFV